MYYHIVKQEGLKYKNLDLKEAEEIVKKEKQELQNNNTYLDRVMRLIDIRN